MNARAGLRAAALSVALECRLLGREWDDLAQVSVTQQRLIAGEVIGVEELVEDHSKAGLVIGARHPGGSRARQRYLPDQLVAPDCGRQRDT
ncbi:MAG TPA: hypothetical protein PKO09_09865 [Anaerolineae bacterium]|nr:hypothetical protein [Anaerolineae bacterium]